MASDLTYPKRGEFEIPTIETKEVNWVDFIKNYSKELDIAYVIVQSQSDLKRGVPELIKAGWDINRPGYVYFTGDGDYVEIDTMTITPLESSMREIEYQEALDLLSFGADPTKCSGNLVKILFSDYSKGDFDDKGRELFNQLVAKGIIPSVPGDLANGCDPDLIKCVLTDRTRRLAGELQDCHPWDVFVQDFMHENVEHPERYQRTIEEEESEHNELVDELERHFETLQGSGIPPAQEETEE